MIKLRKKKSMRFKKAYKNQEKHKVAFFFFLISQYKIKGFSFPFLKTLLHQGHEQLMMRAPCTRWSVILAALAKCYRPQGKCVT